MVRCGDTAATSPSAANALANVVAARGGIASFVFKLAWDEFAWPVQDVPSSAGARDDEFCLLLAAFEVLLQYQSRADRAVASDDGANHHGLNPSFLTNAREHDAGSAALESSASYVEMLTTMLADAKKWKEFLPQRGLEGLEAMANTMRPHLPGCSPGFHKLRCKQRLALKVHAFVTKYFGVTVPLPAACGDGTCGICSKHF